MKGTSLYCYAWDLAGAAGRANQSMIDSLGLDGITLATSYHAGKFIRPGSPTGKVVFPEDGTVYFRPHRTYRQLQPMVSRVTMDEDVLATLTEAGRRHVIGWTVLLHNTRLGYAHPDVVVRNAWGDPAYYSLCPAQPAVQDYAVRLCSDLAEHYDLAGLALETPGFLPFVHGYHHEFAQLPGNPWMNILLGLCFCDACMAGARNAGIDSGGIAPTEGRRTRLHEQRSDRPRRHGGAVVGFGSCARPRVQRVPALALPGRHQSRECHPP
jgi:hypothetical protein